MRNKRRSPRYSENQESKFLVNHGLELCKQLGIKKLLVFAESVIDQRYILKHKGQETIIFLTRNKEKIRAEISSQAKIISLPDQDLSRSDQFQLGLLFSVLYDLINIDETVLCMTGLVGSLRLDNLLITNLLRDNKWFGENEFKKVPEAVIKSKAFIRLLDIAVTLAKQGREGKNIGTIFVLGNFDKNSKYLKQLVLNPFTGHPQESLNIHDVDLIETIREYSSLDGAFIINKKGFLTRAGVFINAPNSKHVKIDKGYGTRHSAAANLTAVSDSVCIAISESSSSITIYFKGSDILRLNSPS